MTATMEAPKKPQTSQQQNANYNAGIKSAKSRIAEAKKYFDKAEITLVKMLNDRIIIKYKTMEENASTEYEVHSKDTPSESFVDAFNALRVFVAEIVFTDRKEREYQAPKIAVKSLNFKDHGEGNIHSGIGTSLTLSNGRATSLNIPQMPMYPESENVAGYSKECAERIEDVLEQTRKFLAGHRSDGVLF